MSEILILASRNAKKLREMATLVAPLGIQLHSVAEFPEAPEVDETGTTFAENAALKATTVARALRRWTVADDSGLVVDALGGAPGVYSARYAGPNATDAENNARMLAELAGVPDEKRTAAFVCTLAVADPDGVVRIEVAGQCRGRIVHEYRGQAGFGYDPLFLIPEYHQTFGELSAAVKNVLSHRARAFQRLLPELAREIGNAADTNPTRKRGLLLASASD